MIRERYRSGVSRLSAVLSLAPLAAALWTAFQPGPDYRATAVLLAAFAFVVWLLVGTDYTFDGDQLRIRSGPFRQNVTLSTIARVRATRTWLAGPAASFDRIELVSATGRVIVSPRDTAGFLDALRARAPQAKFD